MARSDLLFTLIKAGRTGNQNLLRTAVEAMAADERAKRHSVLADRLIEQLNLHTPSPSQGLTRANGGRADENAASIVERPPRHGLSSLVLSSHVVQACQELVEEHARRDLLRSYGLEPRSKVLLIGPPGSGKTSLAEAIAFELTVPLFVVHYETLIGSFLGETSSRLKKLFDYVRAYPCVLFFDEFDTLGKERGDTHDTGEIKRVVSSLLLQIDDLPSHVVVVTATNHAELLDRAVWRRFQIKMDMPRPTREQVMGWLENFQADMGLRLGVAPRTIADKLKLGSFAELAEFCDDIKRQYVLSLPSGDISKIVRGRILQWQKTATPSK